MAKATFQNSGRDGQKAAAPVPASTQDAPPVADKQPAAPPWRRIALCTKSCSAYLGGVLQKVFGGDFITDQGHVAVVEKDAEHFRLVDVMSPSHQDEILAKHADELARVRATARDLGLVALRDGEFTLNKR